MSFWHAQLKLTRFLYFLLIFSVSHAVFPQTSVSGNSTQKQLSDLLASAALTNGLDSPNIKPWYLKATYKTFDDDGKPSGDGIYEEWWAGPNKDKRIFTSGNTTQTEYVTEKGSFSTEKPGTFSVAKWILRKQLISPIPSASEYEQSLLLEREQVFGPMRLNCVEIATEMRSVASAPFALFPAYCFDPQMSQPVLRYSGSYGQWHTIYNKIGTFQNRFIAVDMVVSENANNLPVLTAHVETLKELGTVNDADFVPPAGLEGGPGEFTPVSAGVMQGKLIKGVAPKYPTTAKRNTIEGTVVLDAIVGEDGHIHELKIVSAPDPDLAISAMIAVKQWEYKPYLLNGRPVNVRTQVNVVFRLE